jgi:hypothetical protein
MSRKDIVCGELQKQAYHSNPKIKGKEKPQIGRERRLIMKQTDFLFLGY